MGILDKLMFWKKDDLGDFGKDNFNADMNKDLGMDMGQPNFGASNNLGMPASQGMPDMTNFRGVGDTNSQQLMNQSIREQLGPDYMNQSPSQAPFTAASPSQNIQQGSSNQELQIISAKLDAIKANLDAVNQRLANLERIAYGEQDKNQRVQW